MKTCFKNGKLVLADRVLEGYTLVTEGERILAICPDGEVTEQTGTAEPVNTGRGKPVEKTGTSDQDAEKDSESRVIDLNGKFVMPGMIDIHSDMIEAYIQPRSTAVMEFEMGLREAERVLASCGITTMFHSISMYREGTWDVKEIRQAPQVRKLAALIGRYRHEKRLTRHRYHLRYEIDNLACYDDVMEMMEEGLVDLLSFMDHSPGQGQYKNLEIYRKHQPDEGKNLTDQEFADLVRREKEKERVSFEGLKKLSDCAGRLGISVASHDDDTVEKLKVNRELGVRISEFPITLEVAKAARQEGFMTVVGAPNILLGGSHSGNLSALEAIRQEAADVLVSDYYPQALLHAVFQLYKKEGFPLWEAARYVTLNPAKAVGMDGETGSLEPGKLADLLIVDGGGGMPLLEQVYVAGQKVFECSYREADQ